MNILSAFKLGNEIANAEGVKTGAITVQSVASLLGTAIAVAGVLGYQITISAEDIQTLAGGIFALLSGGSAVVNLITSKRIGFGKAEE
jgi:hypothetical protein